jgi:hypothetical protein
MRLTDPALPFYLVDKAFVFRRRLNVEKIMLCCALTRFQTLFSLSKACKRKNLFKEMNTKIFIFKTPVVVPTSLLTH